MGQSCSSKIVHNTKAGVVDLYVFPRTHQALHMSPPCCKIEAFLRYNSIPYFLHCTTDFDSSPNGRLPYAVIDNKVMAESELIIEYLLEHERYAKSKQPALSARENRVGRTLHVALEYGMRFNVMRWQLVDHLDWVVDSSRDYAPSVPRWVLAAVLSSKNRSTAIATLNGCGHGDKTHAHFHADLLEDVKTIEAMIQETGDKFILSSDKPSRWDAEVYSMLHLLRISESIKADAPGAVYALASSTIVNYIERMDAICFPDMEEQLKNHEVLEQDFSECQWTTKKVEPTTAQWSEEK